MTTPSRFASILSFLDPLKADNGEPYGPFRYKEIAKERYLISKHINTSYTDLGKITPLERRYLLEFVIESSQAEKDLFDQLKDRK